jgi:hypothetical protein
VFVIGVAQDIVALVCDYEDVCMHGSCNGEERRVRVEESERRWQDEGEALRGERGKDEEEQKQLMERISAMVEKCSGRNVVRKHSLAQSRSMRQGEVSTSEQAALHGA